MRSGVHQTQDVRSFLDRPIRQRAGSAPPDSRGTPEPGHVGGAPACSGGECCCCPTTSNRRKRLCGSDPKDGNDSQIRKRQSSGSMSEDRFASSAREYVESLHQNSRTHLLYGKNNVLVQPVRPRASASCCCACFPLRAFVSLRAAESLGLKRCLQLPLAGFCSPPQATAAPR